MERRLLVFLAVLTVTAAMVPRQRRALNVDDETEVPVKSSTLKPKEICAPQTPCAWSIYKVPSKIIDFNFTNTYCICSFDTLCQITKEDFTANAFVHHCRTPGQDQDSES